MSHVYPDDLFLIVRSNSALLGSLLATLIERHQRNILLTVAMAEVLLMPFVVLSVLTGFCSLVTPFIYSRFQIWRHASRRNSSHSHVSSAWLWSSPVSSEEGVTRSKKTMMRMVSVAGSGSRQDEEALAASALLDLATPVPLIDNKTSVITSNPTLSSYNRNSHPQHQNQSHEKETKQGPNGIVGEKDGLVHLMVTSNAQGQRVLQLPNGMEFLFDPRPGTTPPSSITLPSSLLNGTLLSGGVSSSAGPAESGRQYAVIDLSKKRVKQESEQDGNNNSIRMDQENPLTMCPNHHHHPHQQQQTSFSSTSSSSQEVVSTGSVPPVHLLPPNVLHFLPQGNHMNTGSGVYCDNGRRSFSSGSSSCSSVDGSESCCSSSGGGTLTEELLVIQQIKHQGTHISFHPFHLFIAFL